MDRRRTGRLPLAPVGGLSRRAALRGLGGLTATLGAVAGLRTAGTSEPPAPTPAPLPPPPGEPQLREFVLTASEFDWEVMPGTSVRAWGYEGQVPGPELRVREGDRVRVTLRNALPVPTTIHWHGIHNTPAMDGPAGLNQAAVEPGAEFVYDFVARPAGTRWYHSHADPALQVPLGLYGPLIVEPTSPARTYEREYTYILQEWDLELTPAVAAGKAPRGPGDRMMRGGELGGDLFLFNGRMHGAISPIRLATGDRVLVRLINAGHMPHGIHTHGHSFKIVATDGNPVPEAAQLVKDTILVGPAERYDLEFVGDNPGVWMVHCHMEHHMANGMMTLIAYDGHQPTGPAGAFFDLGTTAAGRHDHGGPDATTSPPAPDSAPTAAPSPSPSDPATSAESGIEIAMVDDRFEPAVVEVAAGTTVVWVNRGQDWHSVAAYDGSFESVKLGTGERFSFRFDQPGDYKYICKHHGLQGMIGKVVVT